MRALNTASFALSFAALLVWIACLLAGAKEIAIVPFAVALPFLLVFAVTGAGPIAKAYRQHVSDQFGSPRCVVCGTGVPRGDAACSPEHLEEHEARTAW